MIAVTLIRASGIAHHGGVDGTWEIDWQYLSAEVGLLMDTATAFRSFFIACSRRHAEPRFHPTWYETARQRPKYSWRSARTFGRKQREPLRWWEEPGESGELMALPQIPRPTMTGIRTFISGSGGQSWRQFQLMRSHIRNDRTVDTEYP